jgi:hypothetical protein
MRRKQNLGIDLPWQLELLLIGAAAVAGAAIVALLATVAYLSLAHSFESLLSAVGADRSQHIPFPALIWPLLLFTFASVSFSLYSSFREVLTRRLAAL